MAKKQLYYAKRGAEVIKIIQKLGCKHSTWQVFQDFLAISAIAISNTVDWGSAEAREKEYQEIIKRYNQEEMSELASALAYLKMEMTELFETKGPTDILGEVFHGLQLHNKYKGQFFTPFHICECMGQMMLVDNVLDGTTKKDYISLCEPCVGAGGMVLGFANAMHSNNINFQQKLCVTACDIDIKCVHMAYLQLSLYGIPATILHGNTLTNETWSVWYTPMYMTGGWEIREHSTMQDIADAQKVKEESNQENRIAIEDALNITELENGQFCLI